MKTASVTLRSGMWHVILHDDTLGVTKPALKAMRDIISDASRHRIVVWELRTPDGCYGFAVVDDTIRTIAFVGDGFRLDGGGEGGAGHRSVHALLQVWGIEPFPVLREEKPFDTFMFVDDINAYKAVAENLIVISLEEHGYTPLENDPEYIRVGY